MRRYCFFFLVCLPLFAYSQAVVPPPLRNQILQDRISQGGINLNSIIFGLPPRAEQTVGSSYLDTKWNKASIILENSTEMIEGVPVKYDLKAQNLELLTTKGVKVLDTKQVKSMVWLDSLTKSPRYFVGGKNYQEDGVPLHGLLEVLSDGHKPLLCFAVVWYKKPDYVPAIDVGSRDTKIIKEEAYYSSTENQLTRIKGRKKLLLALDDRRAEVENFIKVNHLDTKQRDDLAHVFEFYNSKFQK